MCTFWMLHAHISKHNLSWSLCLWVVSLRRTVICSLNARIPISRLDIFLTCHALFLITFSIRSLLYIDELNCRYGYTKYLSIVQCQLEEIHISIPDRFMFFLKTHAFISMATNTLVFYNSYQHKQSQTCVRFILTKLTVPHILYELVPGGFQTRQKTKAMKQ